MAEERDLATVSAAFISGILLAHAAGGPAGLGLAASAALLPSAGLAFIRGGRLPFMLLFFATGAASYCGAAATEGLPGLSDLMVEASRGALERLRALIASMPAGEDAKSLLQALLTGDRSGLGREVTEDFRRSGASHILALSGLHLGIIYLMVRKTLSVFGNSRPAAAVRAVATVLCCMSYTFMTGAGESTVRALIYLIYNEVLSFLPGRGKNGVSRLCGAAMIQLCLNPLGIRSTGFQLSYLAMAGTALLYPALGRWYPAGRGFNPLRSVWKACSLSFSCQLFTAPLVLLRFGTFPKYFIIANLVALPLTEALMVTSAVALAALALGTTPVLAGKVMDLLAGILLDSLRAVATL